MKNLMWCAVVCLAIPAFVAAQRQTTFPGLSPYNREVLNAARQITPIPLPTWIPAGFTVEKVNVKLGSTVAIEDRVLAVIYSRKLENGKIQRFSIEAGFEGLGDLPYDSTSSVRSAVGRIDIAYQPPDLDGNGTKINDFAMTHWFNVAKTAFHYDGMYGAKPNDRRHAMITLADTRKILASLKRF
ncbi:MAG: hypothetical protein ABI539_06130 [Acidobacteriota bacterium]